MINLPGSEGENIMSEAMNDGLILPEVLVQTSPTEITSLVSDTENPSPSYQESFNENSTPYNRFKKYLRGAIRSGQVAIAMVEVLPTNEAIRAGLFGVSETISRDPLVGAISLGLSTFVIEEVGGLAASRLLTTERGKRVFDAINKKGEKLHIPMDAKLSTLSKAGWTLMGGTVVGMALEQREDTARTKEQNDRYSLFTSAWLAGVCAVGGALASEGIRAGINNPVNGAAIAGSLIVGGSVAKKISNKFHRGNKESLVDAPITDIDANTGRIFQYTTDPEKLKIAADFEQKIWFEEQYGSLEGYAEYIANSRTITAFDGDKCVGIVRLFESNNDILPPFVSEMPFYDQEEQQRIADSCREQDTEELGTIAIEKELRHKLVFENLARLAYRDAYYGRGIKNWGIIMEPKRVQSMNRRYGFTFKQMGPEIDYQGGKCAAHVMSLKEVNDNMSEKFPDIYNWFVNEPLNS